jgi:hypothetical protein
LLSPSRSSLTSRGDTLVLQAERPPESRAADAAVGACGAPAIALPLKPGSVGEIECLDQHIGEFLLNGDSRSQWHVLALGHPEK